MINMLVGNRIGATLMLLIESALSTTLERIIVNLLAKHLTEIHRPYNYLQSNFIITQFSKKIKCGYNLNRGNRNPSGIVSRHNLTGFNII